MKIYQVDAFTAEPFAGNPAAVCVLSTSRDDRWMQHVAREMNLSETAFLRERPDGYDLRWFTPTLEVDLCGHATLASAHVLWEELGAPRKRAIRFHTASGELRAARDGEWIELDFPAEPERPEGAAGAAGWRAPVTRGDRVDGLSKTAIAAGAELTGLREAVGGAPIRNVAGNRLDVLVELESEDAVYALRPDLARIAAVDARGVIVTAASATSDHDFVSRYFAPNAGVLEDPVTGSTHCFLGPYWMKRLGRDELIGYQASERGGHVRVRPRHDRVFLGGRAVLVLRGELL
ncbi:MAG: PhzF family phenazine biosynthesis protein [Gemmatimonadota bacterium]